MSPYRVLVKVLDSGNTIVLCAMLSKDKKTGEQKIYIITKHFRPKQGVIPEVLSDKVLAHMQSSRRNSEILDCYVAERNNTPGMRKYTLKHIKKEYGLGISISDNVSEEYTLSNCLETAMNDFCERNNVQILKSL